MENSELDRAISAVARDITEGEPSAAFRTRVIAKLPGSNSRRGKPWFWIGGTLVAAGAAVALMVITRTPQTPAAPAHTTAAVPRPLEPLVLPEPRTPELLNPNPRTLEPRTLEPSPSLLAWESRAIPALVAPESDPMTNIQPEPLEIRPLVTPALSVPAIGEEENK